MSLGTRLHRTCLTPVSISLPSQGTAHLPLIQMPSALCHALSTRYVSSDVCLHPDLVSGGRGCSYNSTEDSTDFSTCTFRHSSTEKKNTGLCKYLGRPTHARLYIGLARAHDVRYRHISSSSNARWGSLKLAPIIFKWQPHLW